MEAHKQAARSIVVGIVGGFGSGKSFVASLFGAKDYRVISLDKLGHEALRAQKAAIVSRFGQEILDQAGDIARAKLGKVVFADAAARADLEHIVHPYMTQRCKAIIAEARAAADAQVRIVIDGALLFEMGLDALCDTVVLVEAPALLRAWRGTRRDKRRFAQAWHIIRFQAKLAKKHPRAIVCYNIFMTCTKRRVAAIIKQLEA